MPTFIINGDPISVMRPRNLNQHYWDSLKILKHNAINQLEDQIEELKKKDNKEHQPFAKPIHVEYHFYFQPLGHHRANKPYGYNHARPDMTDLIKFVENVSTGILFTDASIISSMTSIKRYSDLSRTEIIINEIPYE